MVGKLKEIARASKFDSCGYSSYFFKENLDFIYPAVAEGRCIPLFKVLQTNYCEGSCFYCANRKQRECNRFNFSSLELASLFMQYYKKNLVEGFFLSSGVFKNPNFSEENMLKTLKIVRHRFGFDGYIHCVILPGTDESLIREITKFSDRVSINLEAPNQKYLSGLSPEKNFSLIFRELKLISEICRFKKTTSTQLVVGASNETDHEILNCAFGLYQNLNLSRVYYSGFEPVRNTPLENRPACPSIRELRLYQADILLRKYGFLPKDLVFDEKGNLPLVLDPKFAWAEKNKHKFPIEINKASLHQLLYVPGIGKTSAKRIVLLRREKKFKEIDDLKKIGVVVKRVQNFITLDGKFFPLKVVPSKRLEKQLFLFDEI